MTDYERYVISEIVPISILDMDTGETYPIEDEGIFETVCKLLNELQGQINAQSSVIEEYQKRCDGVFKENLILKGRIQEYGEQIKMEEKV